MFVAVPVPAGPAAAFRPVLEALADRGARAVPVDRLHLTVAFMATVPGPLVDDVAAAVRRAAGATPAFGLATTGVVDRFGARVAWAELLAPATAAGLADRLREVVGRCGVELPDRPFRAHLTLARAGRRRINPAVVADLAAPIVSWQVREVLLVHSVLGQGPARWHRLATCPLQPAAQVGP